LIDPQFAEKLAEFAAAFAGRYPWIVGYTPINEICTTARFSGLYGLWYPHRKDMQSFVRIILNECRATVLSMAAIRRVNPGARLIQTDDLGEITSTPLLQYQADHENDRRWLGFDLLCGRVTRRHPLWDLLLHSGAAEHELHWFVENACPPDLIGLNHYFLSNRHLDEAVDKYPASRLGGNGRHVYADVETVRIAGRVRVLPHDLYRQAWERYGIPVAATEVHADATREDQVRWLMEIWNGARKIRAAGVDIRAVTYWGLLGHYDWHCLVTRCEGRYESGAFDVRAGTPRATLVSRAVQSLAVRGDFTHPVLDVRGWWGREVRVFYPKRQLPPVPFGKGSFEVTASRSGLQPILIVGRNEALGKAFARVCEERGLPYRLVSHKDVQTAFQENKPWAVINATGDLGLDDAETQEDKCRQVNLVQPTRLAELCADHGLPFVTFSSDQVFDGKSAVPYRESSQVSPLNVFGRTKAEAEQIVLRAHPGALVIRTGAFFGPWGKHNFVASCLKHLRMGRRFLALTDVKVSPTYVPDLVHTALDLMLDQERGIWNLANEGEITWFDLALEIATRARRDRSAIIPRKLDELDLRAPRPHYSVLSSERAILLPTLDAAIQRYFRQSGAGEHS
jgi:dTDP-4-dehydrorhamnose reductase